MKRFIIAAILAIVCVNCLAEVNDSVRYKLEGKVFETVSKPRGASSSSNDVATDYVWKDRQGNQYKIYLHQITKGERQGVWVAYVNRTSQKTGKVYKYYLPDGDKMAEKIMSDK